MPPTAPPAAAPTPTTVAPIRSGTDTETAIITTAVPTPPMTTPAATLKNVLKYPDSVLVTISLFVIELGAAATNARFSSGSAQAMSTFLKA
ncbi:hypothetical protein LOD99_15644 [Oopsacas minuta]|uniref:Uncharacterized protein n=1 Tax=Oopsacas minuta TaxID=111878 RepID=A0AAV7KC84_9METZ|nr:hypothetical protein LOD99_15644 [Oopsacas minuta]